MMCGGGKNQTTTSQVTIPPEVLARYNTVNNNAATVAATPFQAYSSDPNAFVAQTNSTEHQGTSDIAASGAQANLGSLNTQQYLNPYIQDVAQSTEGLLNQQNQQAMSGQLGNAAGSGAAFGDRSGVAAANLNQQQQLSSANILSNIFSQGYTQAQGVAQQQQGAQLSADQANLARQGAAGQAEVAAGQVQQQTDQAGKTALYNQFEQQQAYPFQTAQFQANIAEGTGANSGSTTTSTSPAGFFSGFAEGGTVEPRAGLADGGQPAGYSPWAAGLNGGVNPNTGAYGSGGANPGLSGYVPGANLPTGHLMTAQTPPPSQDHTNVLAAASNISNTVKNAPADWKAVKDTFSPPPTSFYAKGGKVRAGLADGGLPYDDNTMGAGYVPDNSPSQTPQLAVASPDGKKSSGLDDIAAIGGDIAKIIPFLARGGRAGFDDGGVPTTDDSSTGAPTDGSWADWLQHMGSKLGLAEDRPVAQIRADAYNGQTPSKSWPNADTPPAPQMASTANPDGNFDPVSGVDMTPSASTSSLRPGLGSDIASLWSSGPTSSALFSKSPFVDTTNQAPATPPSATSQTPPSSVPARGAGVVPDQPPAWNPLAGSGNDVSQYPLIADNQPPAPQKAAGLQPTGMNGPKTMSPVPTAQSQGNAFQTYSESALNHEGLAVDSTQPDKPPTLAGFDAGFYGKPLNQVRPLDVAQAQKRWYDAQGGDQLAQKYGPGFAAAYVNLSMLNPNITKQALAQSGGDQNKFFGIVSNQLQNIAANKVKQGLPDYSAGWANRVADNEKIAGGADPSSVASSKQGPLSAGLVASSNSQNSPSQNSAGLGGASITPAGDQAPQPTGFAGAQNFLDKNKNVLVPLLTGLGAMASSPSRYFGSALLQGAGAAANSYATYPKLQADIANSQAIAAQNQQKLQQGDVFVDAAGIPRVSMPNGSMTLSQWNLAGRPATLSQSKGSVNPSVIPSVPTAGAGSPTGANADTQGQVTTPPANQPQNSALPPELDKLVDQNGPRVSGNSVEALAKNPEINAPFEETRKSADGARAATPQLLALTGSLADLPANFSGPISSETLLPFRKNVNDLAQQIGLGPIFNSNGVANVEEVKKLTALAANSGQASPSVTALSNMLTAFPSDHLSKAGQAKTVASTLILNQRSIDEDEMGGKYRTAGEQRYGLQANQSAVSGDGFKQAFNKYEQPRLARDQQTLEKMFNDPVMNNGSPVMINGVPQTTFGYISKNAGNVSPQFIKGMIARYGKDSPDVLRYFNGGKGG